MDLPYDEIVDPVAKDVWTSVNESPEIARWPYLVSSGATASTLENFGKGADLRFPTDTIPVGQVASHPNVNAVVFPEPAHRESQPAGTWTTSFKAFWGSRYATESVHFGHALGRGGKCYVSITRYDLNSFQKRIKFVYEDPYGKQWNLTETLTASYLGDPNYTCVYDPVQKDFVWTYPANPDSPEHPNWVRYVLETKYIEVPMNGGYSGFKLSSAPVFHLSIKQEDPDSQTNYLDVHFAIDGIVSRAIGYSKGYHFINFSTDGLRHQEPANFANAKFQVFDWSRHYTDEFDNVIINGSFSTSNAAIVPLATTSSAGIVRIANDIQDQTTDVVPTASVVRQAVDDKVGTNHTGNVNIVGSLNLSHPTDVSEWTQFIVDGGDIKVHKATLEVWDPNTLQYNWVTDGGNLEVEGTIDCASIRVGGNTVVSSQWTTNSTGHVYMVPGKMVGIGKSVPTSTLDVGGTIKCMNLQVSDQTVYGGMWLPIIGGGMYVGPEYIGGNIGIGTTTPAYKLDVAGTINCASLRVAGNVVVPSQWTTNGSNIYYNTTGGYVGIGTVAPSAPLHVVGNSVVSGQMGIGTDPIGSYKLAVNGTLCTAAPTGVFLWCGTGTNLADRIFALTRTGNNVQADLFTNSQDFYFATIRNFGLGTSTPAYKLDVNGTINATEFRLNGNIFTGGASQWTTTGSNISYSAGNVGIANASPQYALDVAGAVNCSNLYVNASASSTMLIPDVALTTEPASYTRNGIVYKFDAANDAGQWGDKTWLYDNVTTGGLTFAGYSAQGIYTTTGTNSYTTNGIKGAYFGIKSDSASFVITGYRIQSYASPFTVNMKRLVTMGTNDVVSGTPVWTILDDYTLTAAETASQTFDRTFANTSTYRTYRVVVNTTSSGNPVIAEIRWRIPLSGGRSLTIANGGNVGVNTSTPTYNLDVNGTINCTEFRVNGNVFSGASKWTANGTNIYFNTGNVGIGTTSPAHKLDVSGAINATEFRLNGNLFTGSSQWVTSGDKIYYNSGNVGIGVANPTSKLEVGGSFSAGGLTTPFGYFVQRASGSTVLNWGGVNIAIEYSNGGVYVADRLIVGGGTMQQGFLFSDDNTGNMHVMVNTNATQASSSIARKIVLGSSVNDFATFSADRVYMYSPLVVNYSVTATAFTNSSDVRLKQNIQAIHGDEIMQALCGIGGYRYQFRSEPERTRVGFIAQEVAEVFPEAVTKGDDGMLQLEYSAIIPVLVEAVKHLSHRIDLLEGAKRIRV